MPTYEFRCPNGHDFEKFNRSMASAPTELPCPVCRLPAERLISGGAGLLFKGSGFYITDYGKDGKKDQQAAPKAGADSTTSSGSGDAPSPSASAGTSESSKGAETSTDKGASKSSDAPAPAPAPTKPAKSSE